MKPTLGSLFAGIGGIDLGFERAGFKTVWQVEIDPYCRKVLARHFPDAERFEDVRRVGASCLRRVDVIAGGFPCQDISNAGKRVGIEGERSGLWSEYARIIGELRPKFVFVENVAALLGRGMGRVLGDLSALGYDAEWRVISAADVGAPHLRERIWILAYDQGIGWRARWARGFDTSGARQPEQPLPLADTESKRPREAGQLRPDESAERSSGSGQTLADARRKQSVQRSDVDLQRGRSNEAEQVGMGSCGSGDVADSDSGHRYRRGSIMQVGREWSARQTQDNGYAAGTQWSTEPNVGRVAHGVPARVDRLTALGNAVVPQIPELIARRIKECL